MNIAISNIAWSNDEEPEIARTLQSLGVKYIELAPTKQWADPTVATNEEIRDYLNFWESYGIKVIAFQSMLFSRPDLTLFGSQEKRQEALVYLKDFIRLAGDMGVSAMVFGSPKNRQVNGHSLAEANQIAIPFFEELGQAAEQHNLSFCIEPNAEQYNCDFVTTAEQGLHLVETVNHPGFGLHLDTACMSLAGDNLAHSIHAAKGVLRHFHVSAPMLGTVNGQTDIDHASAAAALRDIGYSGYVSIEMRPEEGSNMQRVVEAIEFTRGYYG